MTRISKKRSIVVSLLLLGIAAGGQIGPMVAKRLKEQHPAVRWNETSATTVDIDCDGKPDTFVWGVDENVTRTFLIGGKTVRQSRREIVLGVERAGAKQSQTENIPFRKDTGYYGFCILPKTIEVKPLSCEWEGSTLPGCVPKPGCQALWIRDDECGAFFVFWDSSRQRVTWLRH